MRCKKMSKQFSAYLDGQLTAAERKAMREHLAACAQCRGELEALGRTAYAVADLPRLRAPADLRDQVMAKLDGVAPEEARHPRWRLYWGAAAAIAFAVVIMLLTAPPRPRATGPEQVAAAAKKVLPGEVALAERNLSAGAKGVDGKLVQKTVTLETTGRTVVYYGGLQKAANLQPIAGTTITFGFPRIEYGTLSVPAGEPITLAWPSTNPRAAYLNAVAIAAKGGWLPAELQKDAAADELLKAGEKGQGGQAEPRLTLRMKRSELPLLEKALYDAALQPVEEKGGPVEEAQPQPMAAGAPQFARARANLDHAAQPVAAAPISTLSARQEPVQAENAATAAAVPAGAGGGAVARAQQQLPAENAAQRTEGAAPQSDRKAEAAEEPLVEVTIQFPLLEIAVPAASSTAAPAAAPAVGAASSITPQ